MLSDVSYKLKLIYLPVLGLSILLTLTISVSYYLLVSHLHWIDPSQEQLFGGIFALSILGLLPLLYVRLKLLWRGSDDRWISLYYMAPMLTSALAALFTLDYIEASTGRLTALASIEELRLHPVPTRYYTLQECHPDLRHIGSYSTFITSGKYDQHLNLTLYVVCPLLAKPTDSVAAAWLGITYRHQISNRLSHEQKQTEYQAFLQRSQQALNERNLTQFTYLTRAVGADNSSEYQQAIQNSPLTLATSNLVLQPQEELFAMRTVTPLRHLLWTLSIGWSIYFIMMLFPQLSPTTVEQWEHGQAELGLWVQARTWWHTNPLIRVTPLLIVLNSVLYLSMAASLSSFSFQPHDLLAWGGSYGPQIQTGEWWRLLSPMFLHGSMTHLACNMISLGLIGYTLEEKLSSSRILLTYIIAGVAGTLMSITWAPEAISVGASGAIFGLIGVALGLLRHAAANVRGELLTIALVLGLPGLLFGFFSSITDNAGHVGGLLAGCLLGLFWRLRPDEKTRIVF